MYWYEKENGALLQFEKDAFLKFMREYNHPNMKMRFGYDTKHRVCVDLTLPVKPAPMAIILASLWRRVISASRESAQ